MSLVSVEAPKRKPFGLSGLVIDRPNLLIPSLTPDAAVALEQRQAEICLQQLDLPADRAVGDMQGLRCASDAAQPGRRFKGAQGIERGKSPVHACEHSAQAKSEKLVCRHLRFRTTLRVMETQNIPTRRELFTGFFGIGIIGFGGVLPLVADADWVMVFDADEFLSVNHPSGHLEGMLDDAVAAGAMGSPTYVLSGEPFWGQDRIEYLDRALSTRWTGSGTLRIWIMTAMAAPSCAAHAGMLLACRWYDKAARDANRCTVTRRATHGRSWTGGTWLPPMPSEKPPER